jgi:hypothetical protein
LLYKYWLVAIEGTERYKQKWLCRIKNLNGYQFRHCRNLFANVRQR